MEGKSGENFLSNVTGKEQNALSRRKKAEERSAVFNPADIRGGGEDLSQLAITRKPRNRYIKLRSLCEKKRERGSRSMRKKKKKLREGMRLSS